MSKKAFSYVTKDSDAMAKVFTLSLDEIECVLKREKKITDVTKTAAVTLSNYARIKSTEIHDKALEIMLARKDIKALPEMGN